MNRNANLALYLAKLEAVEGTDAVPTAAADVIELSANFDPDTDHAHKPTREGVVRGGSINAAAPLTPKGRIAAWTKSAMFRGVEGAITALNRLELDAWFQAAGLNPVYSGDPGEEQVVYSLLNTGIKSMTEYAHHDGRLRKVVGAKAELSLAFDVGGPAIIECASQGVVAGIVDAPVPANPTLRATLSPVAADMTVFTIDGWAAGVIRRFRVALGNNVTRRDGVTAPGGVAGHAIRERKATWEVVLEEPTKATKDFDALVDSQADVVLSWLLGAVQYNRLGFDAAEARIEKVTPSNDSGNAIITLTGGLYGAAPLALTVK